MNAGEKGVAVKAVDPQNASFGGGLTIMVGIDPNGVVLGYSILETNETPGLGAKASEWFQKGQKGNIIGRNLTEKELVVSKDGGDVDAITASTITSRAFLRAVNAANEAYHQTLAKEDQTDGVSGASQQKHNN
jgi:electron transport complex protein RnfG